MKHSCVAPLTTCCETTADDEAKIIRRGKWLVAHFPRAQRTVSWAIVGGGWRRAQAVAWYQVSESELRPPVDAKQFLRLRLEEAALTEAVGLLTSRSLDSYADLKRRHGDSWARCIATVGLGNALRAGDPPGPAGRIGTINVLCHVSTALTNEGLLEALALAAEARALAVREALVPSSLTGKPASGTGTDCIAIAAPETGTAIQYVGKHTAFGHLIGAAVHDAVRLGVERWKHERAEYTGPVS